MDDIRKNFKTPPREFSPVPFWFLNSDLSDEEIEWNLDEFIDKHIFNVVAHPRTGMNVEYLSEAFWERMKSIVEKCHARNIKVFLYDEYNWPSGVMGGKLLREHPEFRNIGLKYRVYGVKGGKPFKLQLPEHFLIAKAVNAKNEETLDLKDFIVENTLSWVAESGKWNIIVFYEKLCEDSFFNTLGAPWCKAERGYIDVLNPKALEYFIKFTYDEYKKRLGEYFGDTIIGIFTDEPSNYVGLMWTPNFLNIFEKEKGYRLEERIQELALPIGDYVKTRCDYNEVAMRLYENAYFSQISAWCEANNIVFTGHLNMEENLDHLPKLHGALYPLLSKMQLPGIDYLADLPGYNKISYLTTRPSLFCPNFTAKFISSIAHLRGAERVLCEIFGGVGWKTTFERMKSTIDWIEACGINLINWHGAHMALEGCRKRDFPPSHFVQQPYWDQYKLFSDYITRVSFMNQGIHIADIALFFPISTYWVEFSLLNRPKSWEKNLRIFFRVINSLLKIQRDYDIIFEDALLNNEIVVKNAELHANQEKFKVLLLPPITSIPIKILRKFEEFYLNGGKILSLGKLPTNSRAMKNDPEILKIIKNIFGENPDNIKNKLVQKNANGGVAINIPLKGSSSEKNVRDYLKFYLEDLIPFDLQIISNDRESCIYNHRSLEGCEVYFIANLSKKIINGEIQIRNQGRIEKWDPVTGIMKPLLIYEKLNEDLTKIPYEFEPLESLYLIFPLKKELVHLNSSNLKITDLQSEERLIQGSGYGRKKAPFIQIGTKIEYLKPTPLLDEIRLAPKWKLELLNKNFLLIEPWTILTQTKSEKLKVSEKTKELWKTLPLRLRTIAAIITGIMKVKNLFRKKNGKKIERYMIMDDLSGYIALLERFFGFNPDNYELYELATIGTYFALKSGMSFVPAFSLKGFCKLCSSFTVEFFPQEEIFLVYEDLGYPFKVQINEKLVTESPIKQFVWDKSNRVLPVKDYLKRGKNEIIIETHFPDYKTMLPAVHGIEPIALMGHIGVKGKKIISPPTELSENDWRENGLPHYSGKVKYFQKFELPEKYLDKILTLELTELKETAEIYLNGKKAGEILWAPYTLDVTEFLQKGMNEIEIIVRNTAENFFGFPKKSGILGPVKIIPYNKYSFSITSEN